MSADEPLLRDLLAFLVGGAKDDMLQNEGLGKTKDVLQKENLGHERSLKCEITTLFARRCLPQLRGVWAPEILLSSPQANAVSA